MISAAATHTDTQPRTIWRDDLVAALTGGLLILGLFLDGWNHLNLQNGKAGEFLTPWHGLLYAGFNACAIWAITRNERLRSMLLPSRGSKAGGRSRGATRAVRREPNPAHLALAGLALASAGVIGDAVARAAGVRPETGPIGAPFDFLLFTGAGLIFAVALRAMSVSLPAISRRVAVPAVLAAGAVVAAVIAFGGTAAKQSVDHAVADAPTTVAAAPAQKLTVAAHARSRAHVAVRSHAAARPAHHRAHHAAAAATVLVTERPQGDHVARAQHVRHFPAVVVQRNAVVRTPAPVRRHAARPAPQRHAAARPHRGSFSPVSVPQAPSNTVTTQVTTTVSSSASSGAKPSAPKPVQTPTASPTPSSPPATPPATAPSNGSHSGGPH